MKETEAKTKWCPFARMSGRFSGNNRNASDEPLSKSIASDCMAWRIIIPFSDKIDNDNGFCGLAGLAGVE